MHTDTGIMYSHWTRLVTTTPCRSLLTKACRQTRGDSWPIHNHRSRIRPTAPRSLMRKDNLHTERHRSRLDPPLLASVAPRRSLPTRARRSMFLSAPLKMPIGRRSTRTVSLRHPREERTTPLQTPRCIPLLVTALPLARAWRDGLCATGTTSGCNITDRCLI